MKYILRPSSTKFTSEQGFSIVSLMIAVVLSGIVLAFVFKTFNLATLTNKHLQVGADLATMREIALQMIDCKRSVQDSPTCTLKDKNGARWPSPNGVAGQWEISSYCNGTSVIVQRRQVGATDQLNSKDLKQWLPLFDNKPGMCEDQFTGSGNPYYRQVEVAVTPSAAGACLWGGTASEVGYIHSGTVYCPSGYRVLNGGATCGTEDDSRASHLKYSYATTGGGLEGWYIYCCSHTISTGSLYAICVRN